LRRNFIGGTAWDECGPHAVRMWSACGPALRRIRVAFGSDSVRLWVTRSGCSPYAVRFRYGFGPAGTDAGRIRSGCGPYARPSTWPRRVRTDDSRLEIIGLEASIRANTECGGECRIGAVAPMSDTLAACREARGSGVHGTLVTRSNQRRLARLEGRACRALARSRRLAVGPGSRRAGRATRPGRPFTVDRPAVAASTPAEDRVRLSLRMTRSEARATVSAASDSCARAQAVASSSVTRARRLTNRRSTCPDLNRSHSRQATEALSSKASSPSIRTGLDSAASSSSAT